MEQSQMQSECILQWQAFIHAQRNGQPGQICKNDTPKMHEKYLNY